MNIVKLNPIRTLKPNLRPVSSLNSWLQYKYSWPFNGIRFFKTNTKKNNNNNNNINININKNNDKNDLNDNDKIKKVNKIPSPLMSSKISEDKPSLLGLDNDKITIKIDLPKKLENKRKLKKPSEYKGVMSDIGKPDFNPAILNMPIVRKAPKFMKPYLYMYIDSPGSNITGLYIVHELTAIIPLVGLSYFFHYIGWSPAMYFPDWLMDFSKTYAEAIIPPKYKEVLDPEQLTQTVTQVAAAYAIVKLLLPIRIWLSFRWGKYIAELGIKPMIASLKKIFINIRNLFPKSKSKHSAENPKFDDPNFVSSKPNSPSSSNSSSKSISSSINSDFKSSNNK